MRIAIKHIKRSIFFYNGCFCTELAQQISQNTTIISGIKLENIYYSGNESGQNSSECKHDSTYLSWLVFLVALLSLNNLKLSIMELTKILRIFYTAWLIIFAIIFLTHCKSNPNQINENIVIDNNKIRVPSNSVTQTDSAINEPTALSPATTSVATTISKELKPVKLIYLK